MGLAAAPNVELSIDGDVPDEHFLSYTVDRDINQPDMAQIVVSNQGHTYSSKKIGGTVTIKTGGESVFTGEILGAEPTFKGGEKTRMLIRAVDKSHRLHRHRKSQTFQDKGDQDILNQVVGDAGLSLAWKHDKNIQYKHVYQHNQSHMEFVRWRAGRMGCHIWCKDTTLNVKQPDFSDDAGMELKVDENSSGGQLRSFQPRMNSSNIVNKMTVKGWNPEKKELITGEATAQSSPLGSQNAAEASGSLGKEESFNVDTPIWSKEEADAIAKARLMDRLLTFITGEAHITGNPKVDLAQVVKITANSQGQDPFNGKYYIMGITHRHTAPKAREGGYITILRLGRDAQGG